ncbi:MAG: YcdB/YcdC domain-containing protein, partial [Tumebacillaceae bacterium]
MKKRFTSVPSILLACAMLSSLPFATVQAADAVTSATAFSKDDAVKKAREVAKLPESNWKLVSIDQRSGQDLYDFYNRPTWVLQFNTTDKNSYANASVILDSTNGQLLGISHFDKTAPPNAGTLTRADAQKVAEDFLQANASEQFKQTALNENGTLTAYGPNEGYNFTYERKVNDVYVLGDQINLTIGRDGTIQGFMLRWTDASFPTPDGKIDMVTAQKTYADSLKMTLTYQEVYKNTLTEKLIYKTSYLPNNSLLKGDSQTPISSPIIDAKSGKTLTASGQEMTTLNMPDRAPLVQGGPIEPKPLKAPLSQEEAENLVKSFHLIPDNVPLVSNSYNENGELKLWNFTYQETTSSVQDPSAEKMPVEANYNISIDATTGEINNFYGYTGKMTGGGTVNFTNDQLKAKATELVKTLYKDRTGALLEPTDLSETSDPRNTNRDFSFGILKNGIATNSGVQVAFDATNGNVLSIMGYTMEPNRNHVSYPTPDNLISADKAKAIYLQNRPLRLSYMFPITDKGHSSTPVLVYTPAPSWGDGFGVDAKTGEWFSADMYQQTKPSVMPTDIKGHWAEKSLTHFAEKGLLELVDGKANPDQKLTRAQVVRLLVDARGGGYVDNNVDPTFADVPKDFK